MKFDPSTANGGAAESALHAAARAGDVAEAKKLIAAGADVNWADSIGETALFGAAAWGRTFFAGLLPACR
jgi:uncharacterized protein